MRYLDFTTLLEGEGAHLALLATFQFDPDFFERRLLRTPALAKARRIVVFIDRAEWLRLQGRDVVARSLNRRYLVVPVHRAGGIFHPKLTLVLRDDGARVLCGSNNLTRSGCAANLELLNAIHFDREKGREAERRVTVDAFAFFQRAARDADTEVARIATEWMAEAAMQLRWIAAPVNAGPCSLRFVHTYERSLWDELVAAVGDRPPKEFLVISPFHDADGGMLRRLTERWPRSTVDLVVQQGYTNLPVRPVKRLPNVHLSELAETSRRLHAKLIAWRNERGAGCVIGSANFTRAAFDSLNVETCLILEEIEDSVDRLFDHELSKRPLSIDDFEPGVEEEPRPNEEPAPQLRVESAVLDQQGRLRVTYEHRLSPVPDLHVALFSTGEMRPRAAMPVSGRRRSTEVVVVPETALADIHGTLMCSIGGEVDGAIVQSLPVWVVQESRLTYEPAEGRSGGHRRVEDTGDGLRELLDDIGRREGVGAVIEYLRQFNIRFIDGEGGSWTQRRFRIKIRDPFTPDVAPEWLKGLPKAKGLAQAVLEFADRHEKQRLRKHARRGNVNGVENFLDIFTTLVGLLHVHVQRNVLKPANFIGRITTYIELATKGSVTAEPPFPGFIATIAANLGGDRQVLRQACEETNYLGEIRAALLIAQRFRAAMDGPTRDPGDVLPTSSNLIAEAASMTGLLRPSRSEVQEALEGYRMFSTQDVDQLLHVLR